MYKLIVSNDTWLIMRK
ncbi:hypothetical protein [Escherichia coli]